MTPEHFLDITDLFSEAMLLLTASGTVLATNAAGANQFGLRLEEFRGKSLAEVIATPPDALAQYLRACSRSRQKVLGALTVCQQDGRETVYRTEGKVVRPHSDTEEALLLLKLVPREQAVSQFLALNQRIEDLSREIARRQRAEQDLRAQREWLHVTLSSIGDAVIATDVQGRVSFLNPVAEVMTGWGQDEAVGRPLEDVFDIIHEVTREKAVSPVAGALRKGEAVSLGNHTVLVARDRSERPINDCGAPIRDGDGSVIGAVLVFHDVTERRAMERELRARAERLAEAAQRKDEWITMLAHELRGPLSPVSSAVEVLRLKSPPLPEIQQAQDIIARQARHLARIVDDLLDVTRISTGKVRLHQERLDLSRLVRTAGEDNRRSLEQADVALTVEVPETPVWVRADATRLTQVVNNLLDNSKKFTPRGGQVTARLVAEVGQKRAVLRVRDTGVGIEPEVLARLFEPFNQADRSLDRTKGGLGLGLALVKGLVQVHGGEVAARSEGPGRGAEFVVSLPMEEEPAALAEGSVAPRPAGRRRRVLVIEDNLDGAESLRVLLEILGYEVRVAYTGLEGVKAAKEWLPAVVLSDIGLPGLDGFGVAQELRRNPETANVSLIAITGYGSDEDRQRAEEAGFNRVLKKPADPAVLQELLAISQ